MTTSDQNISALAYLEGTDDDMLLKLQKETFGYFTDPRNYNKGLIIDKTQEGSPASIAVMGMGLSSFLIGSERKFITREDAANRTLEMLRFLYNSDQSTAPDATGYKGFYYHFLDMNTGKRVWESELSTIDTAILMAGVQTVGNYFLQKNDVENEIRDLANKLYERVDWQWALNGKNTLTHGWTPENGFIEYRWDRGYSEAHIMYILAMGSPTHPIDGAGYREWTSTFEWRSIYDIEFFYAGPLFIHQMSHIWIDFRDIYDDANKLHGIDYFENSRRAINVQQQYAIRNPLGLKYNKYTWGLSASDGPGPAVRIINGTERVFFNYLARGVPDGPDDGTTSPWGVIASLPFEPEMVIDSIKHIIQRLALIKTGNHGFHASFNATFPDHPDNPNGWVSPWQFGLNQGSVVLMIENHWTDLIWKTFSACSCITRGLQKGGFTGGWLDKSNKK